MAHFSDAESDSCSLFEAPRPSTQALMQQAIAEGRLPELVLQGQGDLARSIAMCLEVLGMGTSPPERQRSASRALVGLCTHRKLRPAVDNLLVLRRLCRIIELTDSAVALEAAAEALFAVADDAAWQTKGGSAAETVREALLRCVSVLTAAATADGNEVGLVDDAVSESARMTSADWAAMAAAAAAVLKAPVLPLLSATQLVEAVTALAACIANGCGGPAVFTALSAVVLHGPTNKDRAAAVMAVMGQQGAVAALLEAVASGTQPVALLRGPSGSPSNGGAGLQPAAAPAAADPPTRSRPCRPAAVDPPTPTRCRPAEGGCGPPVQLTDVGRSAFSCLEDVLVSCIKNCKYTAADVAKRSGFTQLEVGHVTGLLGLLQLEPIAPSRVLRALLILTSLSGATDGGVATVLATAHEKQLVGAVLSAADALLREEAAADFSDGGCAAVLLHITSALLDAGAATVAQLRLQAPGLTEAALGVPAGDKAGPAWRGLFAPVEVAAAGGESSTAPAVVYPPMLFDAATELACSLLQWAATRAEKGWGEWLQPAKVADGLIARVMAAEKLLVKKRLGNLRCLTLSLQMSPPEARWVNYGTRDLKRFIQAIANALLWEKSDLDDPNIVLQLAAVAMLSLWSRVPHLPPLRTQGGAAAASKDGQAFLRALLSLATSTLQTAISNAASCGDDPIQQKEQQQQVQQQLAVLAGVMNAVVGCLRPQLALSGPAARPLSPALPHSLLPTLPASSSDAADGAASVTTMDDMFGHSANSSGVSTLLQALNAATAWLSELIEVQLQQTLEAAGGGGGGDGDGEAVCTWGPKEGALLRAAVRVSGNTAKLLSACIPPGTSKKR